MVETYLWIALTFLSAWPLVRDWMMYPETDRREILQVQGGWLFLAGGVLIFPLVFRLVFDALPFEALRIRVRNGKYAKASPPPIEDEEKVGESQSQSWNSYDWLHTAEDEHKRLLSCLASQSAATARGIYSRAGVYLLIGVGIAFSGLAFFYLDTARLKGSDTTGAALLSYAPRFGILFFIELVAFFFLRQYRAAMDEFRYYESLQRHREELLALTLLVEHQGKTLDGPSLVKQGAYYSGKEVLAKGQSTEILEARKLEKDELELLQKVVETVGKQKKA